MSNYLAGLVSLVAHEGFAFGEPRDAEGAVGPRFAPEEQMAGVTPLNNGSNGETDHGDHAGDHDEAAAHVDVISIALAARERLLRR